MKFEPNTPLKYIIRYAEPAWTVAPVRVSKKTSREYANPIGWWPTLQDAAVALHRLIIARGAGMFSTDIRPDLAALQSFLRESEATVRLAVDDALDSIRSSPKPHLVANLH